MGQSLAWAVRRTPKLKRTGISRRVDDLGRVVIPIEFRRLADIKAQDAVMVSLVVDDDNRVRGFLVEATGWVIDPASVPLLNDTIKTLDGPEVEL